MSDERRVFLSTLPAGRGERQLALTVVLVSALIFLVAMPLAKTPLAPVWAFIPIYEAAVVINDLITAVLLFGQFSLVRSRPLWILASGYLFTTFMAISHALTFPGLFSPTGLLGAGPQSTAWLYMFWHGGFPLFVAGYAVLARERDHGTPFPGHPGIAVLTSVTSVLALAGGLTMLATVGQDWLPPIMRGNHYTPAMSLVVGSVWMLSVLALGVLWWRRPHSVLTLWLMVVMCAWLFDIALAAVFNAGRFDLGFYAGRIYGLLAVSFVLLVLLIETAMLHVRLEEAKAELAHRERRALEEENQRIKETDRLKSQFLATMSHELRTPLNSIIGFTDVLLASQREPLSARQRTALERVGESGRHLLGLINDVLDLSKIEAGRADWRPAAFSLGPLVQECLETVELAAQAKGLTLRTAGLDTAGVLVQDRGRVKQILLNLLSNAVKFTGAGSIEVRVGPEQDGMAMIAVADTGIGIAPEHQETIFDRFQQVNAPETLGSGGTGLGLAISRGLAMLGGGTLTLDSRTGEGSVFTLCLPVRYTSPTRPADLPAEAADEPSSGVRRLLVIDDDRNAVDLIREAVSGEPVRVEWAANPAAGLARVRTRRPALILLDVMLQGEADGWDVLDALKSDPGTRDIPVVVHSVIDNRRRAEQLGADDVLVKPVPAAAIRAVLAQCLPPQRVGVG